MKLVKLKKNEEVLLKGTSVLEIGEKSILHTFHPNWKVANSAAYFEFGFSIS